MKELLESVATAHRVTAMFNLQENEALVRYMTKGRISIHNLAKRAGDPRVCGEAPITRTVVCNGCHAMIPLPRGDVIQFISIGVIFSGWALLAVGAILFLLG